MFWFNPCVTLSELSLPCLRRDIETGKKLVRYTFRFIPMLAHFLSDIPEKTKAALVLPGSLYPCWQCFVPWNELLDFTVIIVLFVVLFYFLLFLVFFLFYVIRFYSFLPLLFI
jgi:hypothetical protein